MSSDASVARISTVSAADHPRSLGRVSMTLAVVAAVASTSSLAFIGATLCPMEAQYGRTFSSTPTAYSTTVLVLLASQVVWSIVGITALTTGIATTMRRRGRHEGTVGIIIAVAAPLVAITMMLILMTLTYPAPSSDAATGDSHLGGLMVC